MKNYNTQDDVLLRKHKEKAGVRRIVEHEISNTVFENHQKSLIQHCERSELRIRFEWTKVHEKCHQNWEI